MALAAFVAALAGMPLALGAAEPPRTDVYGDTIDAGAGIRLGTVRYRVAGWKKGLEFAANDRTLVVAPEGRELSLIDAPTGRHIARIDTGGQWIRALKLAPDRQSAFTLGFQFDEAAAANFTSIKRWDLQSGELLSAIQFGTRQDTEALAIAADGTVAVTGSDDGSVRIWDLASGKELVSRQFERHQVPVVISPDGQVIVVGTRTALEFWKWREPQAEPTRVSTAGAVSLAFSPDGTLLAEGPDGKKEIVLRDAQTGAVRLRLAEPAGNFMYVRSVVFSPDGQSVAAANDVRFEGRNTRRVNLWDTATGKLRQSFETGNNTTGFLAFSRNGRWLAATSGEGTIKVWEAATGKSIDSTSAGHEDGVGAICLSADGRTALTASDDLTARVWDAASGKLLHTVQHGHWVRGAALSPDSRLFATSSLEDTVRLFDTESGREIYRLPGHGRMGGVRALAFAPDGQSVASWGDDLYLRVWDVRTGKALSELRIYPPAMAERVKAAEIEGDPPRGHQVENHIENARFSPDAGWLALAFARAISVFDVSTGRLVKVLEHPDGVMMSVAIAPAGEFIATSSWGRPEQTLLADGRARVSAENRNMVRVREVAADRELFQVKLPDGSAGPLALSANGRWLAAATRVPAGIRVFDTRSGEQLYSLELRAEPRSLAFSADQSRLACGFTDGTALVWDLPAKVDR